MSTEAFHVRFGQKLRQDLERRLRDTRWSDAVTDDWQYGMCRPFLRELVRYWLTSYSFDDAERRLNAMPQARVQVSGFGVHYVHFQGNGPKPTPLLLMNGWPSSFSEYRKLAPMLADPVAFGGSAEDAFDVIMPALPGFGFSDRPTRPNQVQAENLFNTLMTEKLGYPSYVASGTDIGAGVATQLALKFPKHLQGIHIASVVDPTLTEDSFPLTDAELAYKRRAARWEEEEGAYEHLQYTRPQTVAFALEDSPTGLASWIVEKFYFWSNHGPELLNTFPPDMLLDNLMIYWSTGTIGSSMRSYFDYRHFHVPIKSTDRVTVPTAVCMWPRDLVLAPREWAERFYNVQQYSLQAHGGHFPAWEDPVAYAEDVRKFARRLRNN